jgi:hypothetical protein
VPAQSRDEPWLSRVCEEFACTPLVAVHELETDPEHWVERILEYRSYARTRAAFDRCTDTKDTPTGWWATWVKRIMLARMQNVTRYEDLSAWPTL